MRWKNFCLDSSPSPKKDGHPRTSPLSLWFQLLIYKVGMALLVHLIEVFVGYVEQT